MDIAKIVRSADVNLLFYAIKSTPVSGGKCQAAAAPCYQILLTISRLHNSPGFFGPQSFLEFVLIWKQFLSGRFKVSGFNPFMPYSCENYFGDISLRKAIFRKYLKDNCPSELNLQLSFKYFMI